MSCPQGNRLKPVAGRGPGFARFRGAPIAQPFPNVQARRSPAPFLPPMIRAIGAKDGLTDATAQADGDGDGEESVNETRTLT